MIYLLFSNRSRTLLFQQIVLILGPFLSAKGFEGFALKVTEMDASCWIIASLPVVVFRHDYGRYQQEFEIHYCIAKCFFRNNCRLSCTCWSANLTFLTLPSFL